MFADNTPGERHTAARASGLQVCRQGKKGRKTYSIYSGGQKKGVGGKLGRRKRLGPRDGLGTPHQNPPTIVVQQCADAAEVDDNLEEVAAPKKGLRLLRLSEVIGHQEGNDALKKTSKRKVTPQTATMTKKKNKQMSHIRAKWLLGLSLTMVLSLSLPLIVFFYAESKRNEPRPASTASVHEKAKSPGAGGRGKARSFQEDVGVARGEGGQDQRGPGEGAAGAGAEEKGGDDDVLCSADHGVQVEDAARYFKTRLRIAELCSDNSWGKARAGK